MQILSNLSLYGTLGLNSVADANTDTDKFLVIDSSGIVKYRTGAELYSDIGAGGAAAYTSTLQHTVKAGVALTKGQAVYVSSADGTNMIVSKASNASEQTSSKTLGLIAQDLAINDQGFVITEGLLAGIDTSTAIAGDPVWLGTDGNLIYGLGAKPYAPDHLVFVGIVTRVQQNNGEIFVKVQNGFELQELHNVQITSTPSDNAVLAYENSTSLYKMKSISTLLGYTPVTNARSITINGTTYDLTADRTWSVGTHTGNLTTGFVPKATGATTLTDSIIYDNGIGIGINTTSPYDSANFKLDVNGGVLIKSTSGTLAQLILINSNPATGGNNGFVQFTAGGNTATAFAELQSYYGISIASGALRLQPAGGQVLIGTRTTSAYTTDINGTLRVSGQLTLGSTISNNTYVYTMPGATGTLALVSDIPSLSGYLTISSAAATYLTQTSASNTYLTLTNASATYLSQTSASNTYLTLTNASATYLSQTSASNTYLTLTNAAATYLSQTSASNTYLTLTNASSTYLTQTNASNTYVSLSGSYANPSWITSLAWSKITGAPAFITGITSGMVTTALGYTPVTNARTITINGTAYDLSADRSWTVTATEIDTLASVTGRGNTTSTSITLKSASTVASLGGFSVMGAGEFMSTGGFAGYFFENRSGGAVTSSSNWYGWYATSAIVRLFNGSTDILSINGSTGAATFNSSVTAGGNFTTTADGGAGGLRLTLNNTGAGEVQYALLSGGSAGTGVFGIRNGSTGTNLFLMNGTGAATFNGTLTSVGQTIIANAFRFYTGGSDGSTAYGDFRTNPATGNSIISAKSNALYFNYDHGTGGVIFCDGANGIVGSVNAAGVASFNGSVTGSSFIKSGGTSSQFLKADGSVDSNVYLTSGSFLPLSGGTMTGVLNIASGSSLTYTGSAGSTALNLATNDGYASMRVIRNNMASSPFNDGMYIGYQNASSGITRIFGGGATSGGIVVNGGGVNDVTIAGNIALNAGNYNSYSPTLTGGNASGTWSINITGNAGSVSGLTLNSISSAINPDSVTQNQLGYNNSVNLFGQTDGGLYSSAYNVNWIHQIYGDFRSGQIAIRGKQSGTWQAWRVVLDSSNYTSYAPSLTGSGASGTWGINVTGNATYSLNSTRLYASDAPYTYGGSAPYYMFMTYDGSRWLLQVSPATPSAVRVSYADSAGNASTASSVAWANVSGKPSLIMYYQGFTLDANTMDGNSTGFTYSVNAPFTGPIARFSETGYSLQLNAAYAGSGTQIAFRTRNGDAGTFNPWRVLLNDANYTSYSPTLTGGGASGTWGISISGNAANATSISNATGGAYTWTATNYFQSNLGPTSGSLSSPPLQVYATGGNSAFFSWHRAGSYAVNMGLDSDNVLRIGGWSAAANRWQLDMSGNMTVAGLVRAGTNLYTDQNYGYGLVGLYASTRFQGVFAMGDAYKLPADGTGPGNLYGIAWSYPSAGGVAANLNDHGMLVLINGGFAAAISSSIRAAADMRAPIFYDSQNTAYYFDGNSNTSLRTRGSWRSDSSDWDGEFSGKMQYHSNSWYIQGASLLIYRNAVGSNVFTTDQSGNGTFTGTLTVGAGLGSSDIYMNDSDEGTRRIHCNSNRIGFLNQSASWGAWCNDDGSWEASTMYASTMYASNSIRFTGAVSDDNTFGIYFGNDRSSAYGIYREGGGWGYPFPDLRLAFHTGLKFGANASYQGMRFYSDYDMSTIVASINDGDSNMRGYYDIIAYASDRRLKENIKVIDNAIDKVKQLTGMTYTWNNVGSQYGWTPSKEREAGVFAQEVQEVLPEAVKLAPFDQDHDVNGNMFSKSGENFLTVKYEKIVPLLIEAIKEQQQQIEDLKSKLDAVTK